MKDYTERIKDCDKLIKNCQSIIDQPTREDMDSGRVKRAAKKIKQLTIQKEQLLNLVN